MAGTNTSGFDGWQSVPESLRKYKPTVYVDGQAITSVADAPSLQPGINALAVTYDLRTTLPLPLMLAQRAASSKTVNRMLHIDDRPVTC